MIALACQAKIGFSSPWLEHLQQLIKILLLVFFRLLRIDDFVSDDAGLCCASTQMHVETLHLKRLLASFQPFSFVPPQQLMKTDILQLIWSCRIYI